ncbi:MAG: hypothetical protein JWN72_1072 [Thermoleophilia bacterium]|nr:hypothetical protein [Thermoleophilia bacterium]
MDMSRSVAITVATVAAAVLLALPLGAGAHGVGSKDYTTTIDSIEPKGLPIEARMVGGDQLRIENVGDEELTVCGYLSECEPYARLGPEGVFVNENSAAYYANLDAVQYGEVPDDAGKGPAKWVRVRREPAFFQYHDHRVHWMGGATLPPGVDKSSSDRQKVTDAKVDLRYGDTPVTIRATLYYVGGASFIDRYGEYILTGVALLLMLLVFVRDARRRRRARPKVDVAELPQLQGAID